MEKPDKPRHYVNNPELLGVLKEYRKNYYDAKTNGTPAPKIPEYVGKAILQIAHGLSYKPCFINYTYKDEMISDGVLNCLQYIHNFDPAKSSNPFAYITQIIYYAFLRRIQSEKKQTDIKQEILKKANVEELESFMHGDKVDPSLLDDLRDNYANYDGLYAIPAIKRDKL